MKLKTTIGIGLIAALGATAAFAKEKEDDDSALAAQATVSKADAQKVAQAKVPNGTIKESELENENGKIIWSFDMSTPGTTDTTEVNVDAKTGKLVNVETEKAGQEEKEEASEKGDKD